MHSLCWVCKSLPFKGVPFQDVGTKTSEWHQGKDGQTKATEKNAAEMAVSSKTDHCHLYHTLLQKMSF
jgi:hypothetical protein